MSQNNTAILRCSGNEGSNHISLTLIHISWLQVIFSFYGWAQLLFLLSWRNAFRNDTCNYMFSRCNIILSSFVIGCGWQVARGLFCKKAGGISLSLFVCSHSHLDWYPLRTTRVMYISVPSLHPLPWSIRYGPDYLWSYNSPVRVAEINEACSCDCICSPSLPYFTPGYAGMSCALPRPYCSLQRDPSLFSPA